MKAEKKKPKAKIPLKPGRMIFNPYREIIRDMFNPKRVRDGLYAHVCWECSDVLIDETDLEFASCQCGKVDPTT